MQVSSLNEVKIYSLSCGKSLPEVRHFGVPLLSRPPPLSSAPVSVLPDPGPAPGSGRPGEARGAGDRARGSWSPLVVEDTTVPAPEAGRRVIRGDELRWNFCRVL